jgi:O-antigen ligase
MKDSPPEEENTPETYAAVDAFSVQWAGPDIKSTLLFVTMLGVFLLAVITMQLPGWVLYGVAAVLGVALVIRSCSNPEWLLAAVIIYLPFNRILVAPFAPGINATNVLLLTLLFSWTVIATRNDRPVFAAMPNAKLVGFWAVLTMFSAVTVIFTLGLSYLIEDQFTEFKDWIDQFIIFFAFLNLIRDGKMARRIVVYMMLGALLTLALGIQEMLDKQGLDSIEKSRVFGPQMQPNDFGAFLVYASAPFIALFMNHLYRLRGWILLPILLAMAKVLVATFSRGAYIGMAVAGVAAGYLRGKIFFISSALLALVLIMLMPQLIPASLVERMSQTVVGGGSSQRLDASSQNRMVLWDASIDMMLESPVFGKGFKAFPALKDHYTAYSVKESDNHNMYLYIGSQMGIPALLVFLLILFRMFRQGGSIYRSALDSFARTIGMGGATMVAGLLAVNMFGTRMSSINVNGYFWIYLAVMAHLLVELEKQRDSRETYDTKN